jgi:hypothetical protein
MESVSPTGAYQRVPFPRNRLLVLETLQVWGLKHPIHGLIEVDITAARQRLREQAVQTGEQPSFSRFVIACVARAVDETKAVQARPPEPRQTRSSGGKRLLRWLPAAARRGSTG